MQRQSYDSRYAYAVGRIRVLETRLLNKSNIDRMLGAKSAEDAFKVLNDMDYASHSTDISHVADFQKVLNYGLREVKDFLDKLAPDPDVMQLLWLRFDIHNIKTLIKGKLKNLPEETVEDSMMHFGSISHQLLKCYINDKTHAEAVPSMIKQIIDSALELFEKNQNIQEVDFYLDNQFFVLVKDIVKKSKDEFIQHYFQLMADVQNIKVAHRFKVMYPNIATQEQENELDILFQEAGEIPLDVFKEYLKMTNEIEAKEFFLKALKDSPYFKTVSRGLDALEREKSLLDLEIGLDDLVQDYLKHSKTLILGVGPLFAYFLAKQNNAQIIRAIMIGKLNRLDDQKIRKLIRQL